jgi:pantoate--beta-alanine ligase
MEIFKEIAPLRAFLAGVRGTGKTIGLVPTMGALHNGHLALIRASKAQNDVTVCTIYVNPTQFNNAEDFAKYPKRMSGDLAILESANCDIVFAPEDGEMYQTKSLLTFDFGCLGVVMEGKYRPGHFSGVALVVSKLFNIVQPDNAYFGQKDWQQFAIIRQIVQDLKFNLTLHSIPTFREPDGLAMSSRNLRLDAAQRKQATVFYEALVAARDFLKNGNEVSAAKKIVNEIVEKAEGARLEYFEVAESKNLNVLEFVKGAEMPILCIAGYIGDVRLIDNMFLK